MRQCSEDTDKQCTCHLTGSVAYCAQLPWIFPGTIKVKGSIEAALLRGTVQCVLCVVDYIRGMTDLRCSVIAWLLCSYLTESEWVKGEMMLTACSMITYRVQLTIMQIFLASPKLHIY